MSFLVLYKQDTFVSYVFYRKNVMNDMDSFAKIEQASFAMDVRYCMENIICCFCRSKTME